MTAVFWLALLFLICVLFAAGLREILRFRQWMRHLRRIQSQYAERPWAR